MNSEVPKTSTQINESSKISSISNFQNPSTSTQKIFPVNRVSILKIEEDKKVVVRTNVYEPNENNTLNNQKFCVISEIIRRRISLDPKNNSFNNLNCSFNNISEDEGVSQSFQNKIVNIHIADSTSKKKENNNLQRSNSIEYKLLIKRIASKLKRKIMTPTQGYFYFAFQKGNYPLIIIRKIQNQMINHSIEFNNDIFRIYTQKYIQYKGLVKRIAVLLKKSLKNIKFWENPKYCAQTTQIVSQKENNIKSFQVKITQNISDTKTNSPTNLNINTKDIQGKSNNAITKKNALLNKNNSKDNTINSKKIRSNSNNNLTNNNKIQYNTNMNNHNQKNKPQINKNTNFKNNIINYSNSSHTNIGIGSVKTSNYINPFIPNEDRKKQSNFSKKADNIKKHILNKSQINNNEKNKNPNYNNISSNIIPSKIETKPVISTINKNEKIINANVNKNINITNQTNNINTSEHELQITDKNIIDIINEEINQKQNSNSLTINIVKNSNIDNNLFNNNINNTMLNSNNNMVNNNINIDSNINNSILNNNINSSMLNNNINNNILNNNMINNNMMNKDAKLDHISIQSEPILYNAESNNVEMKNNFIKINSDIIPNKKENILEYKHINFDNNNIVHNTIITNLNTESTPTNNNYGLNNVNSADININKNAFVYMNLIPSNNSNVLGITPNNNTINDINNIAFSNPLLIKEKNGQKLLFNSIKNPEKKIVINLSLFKKNEKKQIISKDNSEGTIRDFSQKPISSTTTNIDKNTNTNQNVSFSNITQRNTIITNTINNNLEIPNSLVNEFNIELSNNNIVIKDYLPLAKDEKGQEYMKQYTFWEKYISYLYNIYLINNEKISLFYIIEIFDQYFVWCENTNIENNSNFKKLIIDTVNKIYNEQEKSQFLSMNKINNLEELFKKYELFLNKNKYANYKYGKEIEIKFDIDNYGECNCELCRDEIDEIALQEEINKPDNNNNKKRKSLNKKKPEKYIDLYIDEKQDNHPDNVDEKKDEVSKKNEKNEKNRKNESSHKKEKRRKSICVKYPQEESDSKREEKNKKNRNRKSKGRNKKEEEIAAEIDGESGVDKSGNSRGKNRILKKAYQKNAKKKKGKK